MAAIKPAYNRKLLSKIAGWIIALLLIVQIPVIILFDNVYYRLAELIWDSLELIEPYPSETLSYLHLIVQFLAISLPVLVIALVTCYFVARRYGPVWQYDGETRCRRCKYILRGISEPRCPECGERI